MKKKRILFLAASLAFFGSCTKDQIDSPEEKNTFEGVTSNGQAHVCLDVSSLLVDVNQGEKALVKAKLWDNGQVITVKFLGGSTNLQNRY